jgi:MFS family permease
MKRIPNITIVLLLFLSTMTVMAGAIISPALPTINLYFSALYSQNMEFETKLLITIPALSVALFSPIFGILSDKLSKKYILIFSILTYGIFGTVGFYLVDIYYLILSRFLLGIGMAGIMVTVTGLISEYFQGLTRENFFGLQSFANAISGLLFLTLGGLLVFYGWNFPFLIYTFAFIILPFSFIYIYEINKKSQKNKNNNFSYKKSFEIQKIYKIVILAFGTSIVFYSIPVLLPFYMSEIYNSNGFEIGLAIAFTTLASATSSLFYKGTRQNSKSENIFLTATILMGLGLSSIFIEFENYLFVLLSTTIFGAGMGLIMPHFNSTIIEKVFEENRGKALGVLSSSIFLGMFLSPIFIGFLELKMSESYLFLGVSIFLLGFLYFITERAKNKNT